MTIALLTFEGEQIGEKGDMNSVLALVIAWCLLGSPPGPRTDLTGIWRLDAKESLRLPVPYKNLKSYAISVRETRDSIRFVVLEVLHSGQEVRSKPASCALNGREGMVGDSLPGFTIWMSARWSHSTLHVHKRLVHRLGGILKTNIHDEDWELQDKNTLLLSITDRDERGGSMDSSKCVFRKVH
jgi:hypothetical protein